MGIMEFRRIFMHTMRGHTQKFRCAHIEGKIGEFRYMDARTSGVFATNGQLPRESGLRGESAG